MLHSKRVLTPLFLVFALLFAFLPQRWFRSARMVVLSFLRPASSTARDIHDSVLGADSAPPADPVASPDRQVQDLQRENTELRESLVRIHAQNIDLARKLQAVTQLVHQGFRKVPRIIEAGIIVSGDASDWHSTLLLDRGTRDGIEEGQPVVWGRHLVGKVVAVGPSLSRVRTIVDPGFHIRATIARPPQTEEAGKGAATPPKGPVARPVEARLLGLLEGDGDQGCGLMWILAEEQVAAGDVVVTVEENRGRWPGGLVFGSIVEASTAHGPYFRIRVQPGVDLKSLATVFVLKLD